MQISSIVLYEYMHLFIFSGLLERQLLCSTILLYSIFNLLNRQKQVNFCISRATCCQERVKKWLQQKYVPLPSKLTSIPLQVIFMNCYWIISLRVLLQRHWWRQQPRDFNVSLQSNKPDQLSRALYIGAMSAGLIAATAWLIKIINWNQHVWHFINKGRRLVVFL